MYYFIFYIFILFSLVCFSNRMHSVSFVLFLCFLFSALRFNVGYDYPVYYLTALGKLDKVFEFFPNILIFLSVKTHPQLFFVISSAIIIYFFWKSYILIDGYIKISRLGVVCFVFLPLGFLDSLGVIRQFIAISIFLYAFVINKRNAVLGNFWALVSVLFHFSSVIFIPLLWLSFLLKYKFSVFIYVSVLMLALLFGSGLVLFISYHTNFYYDYFSTQLSSNGVKVFAFFVIIFSYFLLNIKLIRSKEFAVEIFNIFFVGLCIYATVLPYGMHVARGAWNLFIFTPFLMGYILYRKNIYEKISFFVLASILFYSALYFSEKNEIRDFYNDYKFYFFLDDKIRDDIMKSEYEKISE